MNTNNLLINFEGKDINYITGQDGEPMFELYSVGQALGYITKACEKEYPHKSRIDKTVKNADIEPFVHGVQKYLTEEMLYDFIFEAKTDKCKAFRKWVTNEVLPTIRKNGAYVSENITEEQENQLARYGLPSSRKDLFLNIPIEHIAEAYQECLDYNKKKAAPERIKIEKEIISTLEERANTAITNGSAPIALVVQMEISKIQKKITERSNRSYGTRLGNANKKLNMVTKQLEEAQEHIYSLEPTQDEYNCLNLHGFTVNRMYVPNVNEHGIIKRDPQTNKPLFAKSEAYRIWIKDFNREMDKLDLDINFDNGIDIFLYFDHIKRFDASNFHKTFFDCFSNYYGVTDNNFHLKMCDTNEHVDTYDEGCIYFAIRERQ